MATHIYHACIGCACGQIETCLTLLPDRHVVVSATCFSVILDNQFGPQNTIAKGMRNENPNEYVFDDYDSQL